MSQHPAKVRFGIDLNETDCPRRHMTSGRSMGKNSIMRAQWPSPVVAFWQSSLLLPLVKSPTRLRLISEGEANPLNGISNTQSWYTRFGVGHLPLRRVKIRINSGGFGQLVFSCLFGTLFIVTIRTIMDTYFLMHMHTPLEIHSGQPGLTWAASGCHIPPLFS